MEEEIGKVAHWYDKINVAVLDLSGTLKIGDKIKVSHGNNEFECAVESMQVNHEQVPSAKKGDEVAIKLPQKTKTGAVLFKVE